MLFGTVAWAAHARKVIQLLCCKVLKYRLISRYHQYWATGCAPMKRTVLFKVNIPSIMILWRNRHVLYYILILRADF